MANPTTAGAALAPTTNEFATRVQLVGGEITRRRAEARPTNATAFTAAHWVRWIRKNILEMPVGKGCAA